MQPLLYSIYNVCYIQLYIGNILQFNFYVKYDIYHKMYKNIIYKNTKKYSNQQISQTNSSAEVAAKAPSPTAVAT